MLIRQSKNTYIRTYDNNIGYITNQLTDKNRVYYDSGVDFLEQIKRNPNDIEDIVSALNILFDTDKETIRADFMDFAQDLAENKFVVMGETIEDLDTNDLEFNYKEKSIYTIPNDPIQITNEKTDHSEEQSSSQDSLLNQDIDKLSAIQIELTSRCNERCIHCYIPNGRKNAGHDMSFDKFKIIIDQFAEMGGIKVALSGGEALMNKDITKILRYCREKDMQISVLTNLITLNDEHVKILKEVNVSLVKVSLYSMSPKVHDFITTVKGSFKRTKDAIEKLHAANIRCEISCPLLKVNKDAYGNVLEFANSLNMRCVTDYMIMAQSNLETTNLSNRMSIEDAEIAFNNILKNTPAFFKSEPTFPEEIKDMPFCSAGIGSLGISVNGNVLPCPGWDKYVVGNVFKQSLEDIYKNSNGLKILRKTTRKSMPKCLDCDARDYCGICLLRNYNESGGNMFEVNQYFCDLAFLAKKVEEERIYSEKVNKVLTELTKSPIYNLSLSSKELFHSNFLAWLGNNNSTKAVFAETINKLMPELKIPKDGNWTVERENKRFDLCIKDNGKYILVIENKVKSTPNIKQHIEYYNKIIDTNTHFLLLTLIDNFPNQDLITDWQCKTYGELACAMNLANKSSLSLYEKEIIDDYISFISNLNNLQKLSQQQTHFINPDNCNLGKLSDLFEKIRFSSYVIELQNKISGIHKDIIVYDKSQKTLIKEEKNKLYIDVEFGLTRTQGLLAVSIPILDLKKPKITKGILNPDFVIKIQVQGDNYRHVLESFDNKTIDDCLINIGKSNEYSNTNRLFFTLDPLNSSLLTPHYGDSSLFLEKEKIYPIKRAQIKGNWPFASYKNNRGNVSFIYQSRKLKPNVSAKDVINNIVEEVRRFINIF